MKKLSIAALLAVVLFSCIRVDNTEAPAVKSAPKTDGIFLHISKGAADTHDVLMALMLADKFAGNKDVLVFFDKEGIEMVTKDAPNLEMDPFDASDDIFSRLAGEGVTLLACPACMKVSGVEEGDLREGFKVAEKEMFFNFTEGRILTLDY